MATLREDWAQEKVRTLSPASQEKRTLYFMAKYAQPDGRRVYVGREQLAKDCGVSERTIQRHIQKLLERKEIELDTDPLPHIPTRQYVINVCKLTKAEREAITGVSAQQMKLPLKKNDFLSTVMIGEGETSCPTGGDILSEITSTCLPNNQLPTKQQEPGLILKKDRERERIERLGFMKYLHPTTTEMASTNHREIIRETNPQLYKLLTEKELPAQQNAPQWSSGSAGNRLRAMFPNTTEEEMEIVRKIALTGKHVE